MTLKKVVYKTVALKLLETKLFLKLIKRGFQFGTPFFVSLFLGSTFFVDYVKLSLYCSKNI